MHLARNKTYRDGPMLPCSTSAALLLALLLTAASSSFGQASAPKTTVELGQTFTGRVAEITDGDTFELRRSVGGTVMALSLIPL